MILSKKQVKKKEIGMVMFPLFVMENIELRLIEKVILSDIVSSVLLHRSCYHVNNQF